MAKRKVRVDRIIVLIIAVALIGGLLGFGVFKAIDLFFGKNEETNTPEIKVETVESVKLSIDDYQIYEDDTGELGFKFIVADISFTANEPVAFDLNKLQTKEKIELGDIAKYLNKLEMKGYDVSKLEIDRSVVSNQNTCKARLFIPYEGDYANKFLVYNLLDATQLEFAMDKNLNMVTSLKLNNGESIEIGDTNIYVSRSYISSFMLHNDEQYEIASTLRVYTFEIAVNEAQENVQITDAIFIEENSDEEISCFSSEYRSIECENILNKDLVKGVGGALFFEVYSPDENVHKGSLLIKLSNDDNWVKIDTSLQ